MANGTFNAAVNWPCLMYHATPGDADPLRDDYYAVSARALDAQFVVMASHGLTGTTLEAVAHVGVSSALVSVTFDDAHITNYQVGLPVLSKHGATATVFVVTGWVGSTGYCSWRELREMQAAGWSIQSHTETHPFLSTLGRVDVRRELLASRMEIEQRLGSAVTTIALPNGDAPSGSLRRWLDETGYRWAVTSKWGPNGSRQLTRGIFNRYTVRKHTTLDRFESMVLARLSSWSSEGLRLSTLSSLRGLLGPERYRSLRRVVLGAPERLKRPYISRQ